MLVLLLKLEQTILCLSLSWPIMSYDIVRPSALRRHFQQCPWELDSVQARNGQGKVGGLTWSVETAWLILGLAVESPQLILGQPFLLALSLCRASSIQDPFMN